ncbi:Disease resistance protein L6 [Linum perenne]
MLFFSKRSSQQQQEEEEKPSSQSSESSSPSDCLPNLPVGPDSRLTFTDFLYTYLVQARSRTFRDDDELRKGHTIAPELRPFMSQRSGSLSSPLTAPPANGATKG